MIILMGLKTALRAFLLNLLGEEPKSAEKQAISENTPKIKALANPDVVSIWDLVDFKDNTQASHLTQVIGFDEWIDMEEIRRRIMELFGIQYKNERSLYPHLKTLCDLGFFETTDAGGKRKWRKRDLLVNLAERRKKKKKTNTSQTETVETAAITSQQARGE